VRAFVRDDVRFTLFNENCRVIMQMYKKKKNNNIITCQEPGWRLRCFAVVNLPSMTTRYLVHGSMLHSSDET
jgi:hypothetical protein